MREIKFRGKVFNIWVYGHYLPWHSVKDENGKDVYAQIFVDDGRHSKQNIVGAHTVGQYTGLKDKNGKEIYEGDILLLPANTKVEAYKKGDFVDDRFVKRFAIVWAKQCQGYGLCLPYEAEFAAPDVVGTAAVDRMFVIGNIHDNPELLNK